MSTWSSRALEKKTHILSSLPAEFLHSKPSHSVTDTASVHHIPAQFLSPDELAITALNAPDIISSIASRRYSSVQVLKAFVHRAAIAHMLLNCCLEFPYATALERATELDEAFKSSGGKTVGPLHGLPISVKDQCRVIGTETTCGFVANLGKIDTENSLLVDVLQKAGAVVFVKTNLSMGCMWFVGISYLLFAMGILTGSCDSTACL